MPDIRRNSSRVALGYSRPTRFHNQASRIVRLSRSDSSHIERNSASCQPCAWKNREPSAGANWNGALPAATARPQVFANILSNRGDARSISHQRNDGGPARSAASAATCGGVR